MPNLLQVAADAARAYGLDADIFIAMINVESGFRADAVSGAGAAGIAQFMGPTWTAVVNAHSELRQYGAIPDPRGRFNPVAALYASAAHLSDMLRAAGGDYRQALGGYYAGYGRRNSSDGQMYAGLVLGRVGGLPTPTSGPAITAQTIAEMREQMRQASELVQKELVDPTAKIAQAAMERGVPEAPARAHMPEIGQATGATATAENPPLIELQAADALRGAVQRARLLQQAGELTTLSPLQHAQFGAIVGGLREAMGAVGGGLETGIREIGGEVAEAVEPFARPILKAMQWEQDIFGRPLAKAALFPLSPLLPESVENVAEDILSGVLVPSTLLLPQVGRAITVGAMLSRVGLKSVANPALSARYAAEARIALRAMFPNQAKLAAQMHVATRLVAADPTLAARRGTVETLQRQLSNAIKELNKMPVAGDAVREMRVAGKTVEISRADLEKRIGMLRADLDAMGRRAALDVRLSLEGIMASTDPSTSTLVQQTLQARETVARYNTSKLTLWRRNVVGQSDDLTEALRWLNDVDPPANLTDPGDIANWRSSIDWITNLMAEGPYDPKALPNSVFNWMSRGAEPLRNIPIMGGALATGLNPFVKGVGHFFQPLSSWPDALAGKAIVASRYKQAAVQTARMRQASLELAISTQFGPKGLKGEQVLRELYRGPSAREVAETALKGYVTRQGAKGIAFRDLQNLEGELLPRLEAAFGRDIGTVESAFHHPDLYDLDQSSLKVFQLVDEALTADRDAAYDLGVSVGRVKTAYLPHARAPGEPLRLGTGGRVAFPRAFRSRKIEEWDDFVAAAAIDGQDVEYNLQNLLDGRLAHTAEKKTFQVMLRMMADDDETMRFVERPLLDRIKGPVNTRTEEFREQLRRGFGRDMDRESAEALTDLLIPTLPEKLPIIEAEYYIGREFSLVPASRFADKADQLIARNLEAFFRGARTVDMDENWVGNTVEWLRGLLLSADISPLAFVQGARVFGQDPVAYVRMISSGAAWQMTKQGRRVWAIQNAPALRFAVSKGLQLGHPLDISRKTLAQLPVLGWANREMMDMLGVAKLHIFNTTYATLLAAQKNPEIWGLIRGLPAFKKVTEGTPTWRQLNNEDLGQAVASGINNYLGPVEVGAITETGKFSWLERVALLTPSWTRGNIGMILDAPKLGPKGIVARHLFMNQLALQAALATKLSLSLTGKLPSFDPTSTDFLAVQGPKYGFQLFPTMSVFRLPFRLLAGRPEDERRQEDNLFTTRLTEVRRFFEGRMGQGPRILADLYEGEDFLGRKIDAPERYVVKEALPIVAQELWEAMDEQHIPAGEVAQRATLEFLGSQVLPKSPFQLYRERVELLTGKPYDTVTRVERARLENEHEELRTLRARQREYRARRGDALDQFFNLVDDTTATANAQIAEAIDKKRNTEGFLAEYAQMSAANLAYRGQEAEAAIKALFEDREEFESQLRKKPGAAMDEIAREYWSLDPDDFSYGGKKWSLAQAILEDDPDGYRDELWRAFRAKRQQLLSDRAREYGVAESEARAYVLREWPSVRWRHPEAAQLEVRRVAAQDALDELYETSPYRFLDGTEFTVEQLRRLRELRQYIEQGLAPMRAIFNAAGQDLPEGMRQAVTARVAAELKNPDDQKLLAWQRLWEMERFRMFLRNPERDLILVANPDVIKFYPERVRFLLSSRLLNTPLANDPEVQRVITNALAR